MAVMPHPYLPTRAVAEPWLKAGWSVPLARRLPAGAHPVALCGRLQGSAYPFLLESARCHPVTGRYSFLGCDPSMVLRAKGRQALVELESLRALLAERAMVTLEGFPPFAGGAVGVLGYDVAHLFERLPAQAQDDVHVPDLIVGLYETVVAFDHAVDAAWVITRMEPGAGVTRAYDAAAGRIEAIIERLSRSPEPCGDDPSPVTDHQSPWVSTHTQAGFEQMVRQAKRWIAAGDIYQANLSQRLQAAFAGSPWDLYRCLRAVNPSPFAGYFDAGDVQLVSASPERLVRLSHGVVDTRPIAGTWPRTGPPWQDHRERQALITHPKERAEHLMLVDLARNDLGRVCAYGSVAVDELMALEGYSHVFHLVSNVRGTLRPGCDWLDVVAAMVPGGTITGCPKIRSIQLIDALEPVRRQLYTGSLGYVSFTGAMDWNLVIRSAVVAGGQIYVQAGAGIVADSDPTREYEETLHKAEALLVALRGLPVGPRGATRPVGAGTPPVDGSGGGVEERDRAVAVG